MSETIFDKILDGSIPSNKVFEDEDVLAFHDISPQAPIHVVVIPKRKVSRFAEVKNQPIEGIGTLFCKVSKVAELLGLEEDGYRIAINNGDAAGMTVEYLHIHILGGAQLAGAMA